MARQWARRPVLILAARAGPQTRPGASAARVSWRSMVAALAVPAFGWYWAGQLVSVIGTWSQVVADRFPRRQLLIATQITLTIQAVALAMLVALHAVRIWEVGLLAFVLGTATALNNPAQQAFVPELVGRDLVPDAVAPDTATPSSAWRSAHSRHRSRPAGPAH